MFRKSKVLLLVAATYGCSLFLFNCTPSSKENTHEEVKELEQVDKLMHRDSIRADSMKRVLLNQ